MRKVPKSGTCNIFKSPEKFLLFGDINRRVAEALHDAEVFDFFVKCIQAVMPKSRRQVRFTGLRKKRTKTLPSNFSIFSFFLSFSSIKAEAEVLVTRRFFENYSGDNIRVLMRGFVQAGDHTGQRTMGHR